MKEQAAGISFRRVLPIVQLLVCAIVLWPSRYFLLWQVSQSVVAYLPATARQQQPDRTINIEIPSLTSEQQQVADRAARIEDLRMTVPPILNLPVAFVQLPYVIANSAHQEWIPRGMISTTFHALSWPICGLFFWWLAGRGIEAFCAARKSLLLPRITIPETIFAVIFLGFGVFALVGILTSTPDGRADFKFMGFMVGGILWAILSGFSLASRYLQWRIKKRSGVPVLT